MAHANLRYIAGFPYCVFGYPWGSVISDALPLYFDCAK